MMTATETVLEERIASLEETVASLLRMNAYIISVLTPPVTPANGSATPKPAQHRSQEPDGDLSAWQ